MENENRKNGSINIELPEDIAQGIYSNLAIIAHSQSEFIIDFVRLVPGIAKAKVKSRIILTPDNAKRLYSALGENIRKFDEQIKNGQNNTSPFGNIIPPITGPKGEA
ncbi:MAG: DUF3467 domain-containing protein [Bacteroidales bacterium]|jgi:hypothetical protein|nr:DUF3467 domain-containing protein [Bacteroidales bacterium]